MVKKTKKAAPASKGIKELVQELIKDGVDHSVAKAGASFTPPPAGNTYGRLIDYIELGVQKQKDYQGQKKNPIAKVMLTFELLGKNNIKEIETKDKKKKTIADRISITIPMSQSKKAGFYKLFSKMQAGREDIQHMAQMLGEAFKIKVVHNKSGDKIYANITDEDGVYQIGRPFKEVEAGEKPVKIKVAEALSPQRAFLWEKPTLDQWNSIFIDGVREEKDDKGKNKSVSKNYIQGIIMNADNFEGSPIEALLEGSGQLPDNPEDLDYEEEEEEVEDDETEEDDDSDSDTSEDDEEDADEEEEDDSETDEDDEGVDESEDEEDADEETEEDGEDSEEDSDEDDEDSDDSDDDELDESEDDEVEEEEEEPAPKKVKKKVADLKGKKTVAKAPAKKLVTPKKSAPAAEVKSTKKKASTATAPKAASSKTTSPSKKKKGDPKKDKAALKALGLA